MYYKVVKYVFMSFLSASCGTRNIDLLIKAYVNIKSEHFCKLWVGYRYARYVLCGHVGKCSVAYQII